MTARLQVRVLGPLEVRRAGVVLPLRSPLQRRILAALSVAGGGTVSTDRLIAALWGDDPPQTARNSLQSHVARLRAVLGDGEAIVSRPPGYALDPSRVELDASTFEEQVRVARTLLDDDPAAAATLLTDALARWRGDAYGELADEEPCRTAAVGLGETRVEARRLLAEAHLGAGDIGAAVDTLRRLTADEPLREDVALAAARALAAAGRPTDALVTVQGLRRRLVDELGLDPTAEVAALEQRLLRGEPISPDSRPPAPAPAPQSTPIGVAPAAPPRPVTTTVGRDGDLARIAEALVDAPVVTLVGPGGVGKTRLAALAATERPSRSVAWADLGRVSAPDGVLSAVGDALAMPRTDPGDRAVATALRRFRGLVVLDNCEHVLASVAALVGAALREGGSSRVLATSRERLDVPGERVLRIEPLAVPDPATASDDDPAVALFLDRLVAAAAAPVPPSDAARVAAAVAGLPLALELAASRAATIPVDDLLRRLERHLEVLAVTGRGVDERQRTLANVIGWSFDLLTDEERAVFERLSVFASSFLLADAERVCADERLPPANVVDALSRLVEQSLVTRVGAGRYRLLEPLRLFASDRLAGSSERAAVHDRHRTFALDLAARADTDMTGPNEAAVVTELELALPDLRSAHARAFADGDLATVARLAAGLYRFAYAQARGDVLGWGAVLTADGVEGDPNARRRAMAAALSGATWRGDAAEGQRLAGHVEDELATTDLDPWVGITLAEAVADRCVQRGDLDAAVTSYRRNLDHARDVGHDGLVAFALAGLSIARTFQGATEEAERLADEAAALAPAPTARSLAAYALGEALAESRPQAALDAFDRAIAEAASVRARFFEGIARTADVALRGRHGAVDEALARYHRSLRLWYEAGADAPAVPTLRNLVVLLARADADAAAVTLHAALERLATHDSYGAEAQRLRTAVAAADERLGPEAAARAARAGTDLVDLSTAIRFALASLDDAGIGSATAT